MSTVRQVGIKMTVDAQSVTTEVPKAAREFDALGVSAERASARTTRSLAQVQMSVRDIVAGAAGLHVVAGGFNAITDAILAMPRNAFDYSKQLEVSQVGMSGILGSMTAINGKQTEYNTALGISSDMIRRLNDDALRTAATSQELTTVFQALLAPGLSARMTLDEIRQLTVVGTNAVKSMGLESGQVVQELRDLVAGGITPASSTLATALGLKDSDIAEAKASSEGLFAFLMARMKGFEAASEAFGDTLKGKLDQLKEGATRVAAEGMDPLIVASKQALGDVSALFVKIEEGGNVTLNAELVNGIREYAQAAVMAMEVGKQWTGAVWENRNAAMALGAVWASVKLGNVVSDTVAAAAAKVELAQASRLAAAQAAVEAQGNGLVVATAREKLAAYMAELQAKVASAQAEAAAQGAQLATLATTREAIVAARAEVVAKLESTRATMAQSEAQIAAARAAGAQSFAMALVREGTEALSAAQARHALLTAELATLGRQQAGVAASVAAATAAQTAATTAAGAATGSLAAAQNAASVSGRTMGAVMGALGGGVGVAITAVTLLVGLLSKMNAEADRASLVGVAKQRLIDGQADTESTQIVAARLSELKRRGLELEAEQKNPGVMAFVFGTDYKSGLANQIADAKNEIASLEAVTTFAASKMQASQGGVAGGVGQLTLTLTGAEQAWKKSIDGVKTANAAQDEYVSKLSASKLAFAQWKDLAEKSGTSAGEINKKSKEQAAVEKALADERDKKIKELGASAVAARGHVIDAEVAAVQHGYKLLAAQTADGLDAIDSLRKRDVISESQAVDARLALQLKDMAAQRTALTDELGLLKGKKESAKEQAAIKGKLAELDQQRSNAIAKADRDQIEFDARAAKNLDEQTAATEKATAATLEQVWAAQAEAKEIGVVGAALGELRTARVDEAAKQLEAKALTLEGIDLSGRASAALRAQAKAMRDLAVTTDANVARQAVADFARATTEAADAVAYEQSLALLSQRDRAIAIEQYRIAIDLKKRLADIDAKTTTDPALRERLRGEAESAAAKAQVTAASRVNIAEWTKSVDQYNDIFRKGFADMLAHGEDAWDAFTKSLATTFETTVADQLYKAFAEPLVIDVVGNVLGFMGVGGKGGSGSSALSTAGNAASVYNAGSAIIGGGFGAVGGSLGAANLIGAAGGDAMGALIGANAANWGVSAAGSAMSQVMSVAFDPITLGIGALVAVLASMDDSGTYHTGGGATYSAATGAQQASVGFVLDPRDISTATVDAAKVMTQTIVTMLDTTAKTFGLAGGYTASTAFARDSSADGEWGALRIALGGKTLLDWADTQTSRWAPKEFADGDAGAAQYASAVAASIRDVLITQTPDWADTMLNALGDAPALDQLGTVVNQINAAANALDVMGQASAAFAGLTETTTAALITAMGGASAATASMSAYYADYYSESERTAIYTAQLTGKFAELGRALPASKDELRAWVDAAVVAGDTDLAAKLVAMSGAFDQVSQATQSATKAAEAAAKQVANDEAQRKKTLDAALQSATDAASRALGDAVAREKDLLSAQADAAQAHVVELSSIISTLGQARTSLIGGVNGGAQYNAGQGMAVIDSALARGVMPGDAQLSAAISAVTAGLESTTYTSAFDRDRAALQVAGKLSALTVTGSAQLTTAEQTLDSAKTQIARLESIVDLSSRQIDALRGIDTSVLSVADAVKKVYDAIDAERAGPTSIQQTPEPVASFGPGPLVPRFDVGTSYVPYDMLAWVHEGEEITPRHKNPHANPWREREPQSAWTPSVTREMLDWLKAIAIHGSKTAAILERLAPKGDAMHTRSVQ